MRSIFSAPLAIAGAIALSACAETESEPFAPELQAARAEAPARASSGAPAPGDASIAEIAIAAGFNELVAALPHVDAELNAGLVDLFLNGKSQHTVFAPTDEAFGNLYALLSAVLGADIDEITDVPAPVVLDVLLYHVAPGRRAANSVVPKNRERTINPLLGDKFFVRNDGTIRDGLTGIRADDAAITAADISASNGIIHVIDEVIVPPSVVAALTS